MSFFKQDKSTFIGRLLTIKLKKMNKNLITTSAFAQFFKEDIEKQLNKFGKSFSNEIYHNGCSKRVIELIEEAYKNGMIGEEEYQEGNNENGNLFADLCEYYKMIFLSIMKEINAPLLEKSTERPLEKSEKKIVRKALKSTFSMSNDEDYIFFITDKEERVNGWKIGFLKYQINKYGFEVTLKNLQKLLSGYLVIQNKKEQKIVSVENEISALSVINDIINYLGRA